MSGQCAICSSPLKREQTTYCSTTCHNAASAQRRAPNGADIERLWAEGHSATWIGAALGLTKNAVIGRVRRMNLPKRPSPIGVYRNPSKPKAPQQRTERVSTTQRRLETIAATAGHDAGNTLAPLASLRIPLEQRQFAALGRRPPQPAANVVQLRLPITAARACQYPLWGAMHADDRPVFARMCDDPRPGLSPRFCGAPAAVGCSYCARHVAITHRKVQDAA